MYAYLIKERIWWRVVVGQQKYQTQIRSNPHYHGNPPEETSWSICSSANFESVLPHLIPAAVFTVIQNLCLHLSSNIRCYSVSLESNSEECVHKMQKQQKRTFPASIHCISYYQIHQTNNASFLVKGKVRQSWSIVFCIFAE